MYILCITTVIAFKFCAIQLFSCYLDILIKLFIHQPFIHHILSLILITAIARRYTLSFERYDLRGSIKDVWRSVGSRI